MYHSTFLCSLFILFYFCIGLTIIISTAKSQCKLIDWIEYCVNVCDAFENTKCLECKSFYRHVRNIFEPNVLQERALFFYILMRLSKSVFLTLLLCSNSADTVFVKISLFTRIIYVNRTIFFSSMISLHPHIFTKTKDLVYKYIVLNYRLKHSIKRSDFCVMVNLTDFCFEVIDEPLLLCV